MIALGLAALLAVTPHVTEFGGTFGSDLGGIARARDGSLWVNERDRVAHVEPGGRVREYRVPVDVYQGGPHPAGGIAPGPGGDMWFSCETCVGRIAPDGRIRLYAMTTRNGPRYLSAFAASPNAVWFARYDRTTRIVELNARGDQTAFGNDYDYVSALAAAPDGALWIAASPNPVTIYRRTRDGKQAAMGELSGTVGVLGTTPAGGLVTVQFGWSPRTAHVAVTGTDGHVTSLADYEPAGYFIGPGAIAFARDGSAWLGEPSRNRLVRIAPDGSTREARSGLPDIAAPNALAADDAGGAWFTDPVDGLVGHVNANGTIRTIGHGPIPESTPAYPTVASDGAVWFRESFAWRRRLARLDRGGTLREFPNVGEGPLVARGTDVLTSTEQGIVAVAPDGAQRTIVPPVAATSSPRPAAPSYPLFASASAAATAPDGAAWIAGAGEFMRIDRNGTVRRTHTRAYPDSIAFDAHGALWFTDTANSLIGRIGTDGRLRTYARGLTRWHSGTQWIACGPDGAMWFTEVRDRIGRIGPDGRITEFSRGIPHRCSLGGIAAGPDGALWFTLFHGNVLGRMTTDGRVTLYRGLVTPSRGSENDPAAILAPDGHGGFWFPESQGGRLAHLSFR